MASGLDMNGSVLSYFEGTANLHCYFTEDASSKNTEKNIEFFIEMLSCLTVFIILINVS